MCVVLNAFPQKEITGIEDENTIKECLESHQWNLEAAVQDALNEKEGIRPIFGSSAPPVPSPPVPHHLTEQESVDSDGTDAAGARRGAVIRRESWLAWGLNLTTLPLRFVMNAVNELFQLLGKFLIVYIYLPYQS